ncbi:MAG: YfiR family protein [Phycisphaerales bacterium]|nr:MAG: YfiR family protein [Phycisphaerales bacterium]
MANLSATVCADPATDREYRLKAAFLCNFMMFVEGERFRWEADNGEPSDPNQHLQIGIIGKAPFGQAFEPLKNKKIKNRVVIVKWFKGWAELTDADGRRPEQHPQIEAIRQCHVLFIGASEKSHLTTILDPIRTLGMLTVADAPGFLEAGGMINFVIEDKKLRFEINLAATRRAKLQIRSKLLRLARRVTTHDAFKSDDGEAHGT